MTNEPLNKFILAVGTYLVHVLIAWALWDTVAVGDFNLPAISYWQMLAIRLFITSLMPDIAWKSYGELTKINEKISDDKHGDKNA